MFYKRLEHDANLSLEWFRIPKLLDITIDKDLKFDAHIERLSKIIGRKLSAISRICPYLSFKKRKTLMMSSIRS